ncbi:MAG TPA: sensor histidine kinase KdpD [Bacteroidota bacterium]|nr:sensor histidine kinase KdpD [Bacteroidota bacterium]
MDTEHVRPDPDALLHLLKSEEEKQTQGKLKVFFGMCAGVGKTYDMLKDAHEAKKKGIDVVIGYVETHGRPETEALIPGLPVIPRKSVQYKGTALEEMDLVAILDRKPRLVLVDELAHTNAPESRHTKRYQDVLELLDNGIDVFTTLNVQHLESRADAVAQITGSVVRETVPDSVFARADEVEVIDISPEELLKRLAEGKVYTPERSKRAVEHFFRKGNLTALREMSLRLTAERVDRQLRDYMENQRIAGPWKSGQRFLVGISSSPRSVPVIRWARRMSYALDASWVVVNVERPSGSGDADREQLSRNIKLARELGAEIITTADDDVAAALVRVARDQHATQILIGKPARRLFSGSSRLLERLLELSQDLDVSVVGQEEDSSRKNPGWVLPEIQSLVSQYVVAASIVLVVALVCFPLTKFVGYKTISFIILLAVSLLPLRLGPGPVLIAGGLGALLWDFFFIPPIFTFSVGHIEDVMMLLMYFIVAIVTGVLSARVRAREKAVRSREERTSALFSLTKDLSSAHSQDEVITAAVVNIKKYFDADVLVVLGDADGEIASAAHPASSMIPDTKEFGVAAWSYWNEKRAGKFTDTLPSAEATYFPMSGPRYPIGVIGVRIARKLSSDQENLLENFVSQISSAIERELLSEISTKSIIVAESERLYKTLFNSVSHELRTPVATILGASENIVRDASTPTTTRTEEYAAEIHSAAERLNRLVANLLDMTRLESGMIQPKLDWCDIRDVINSAVRDLGKDLDPNQVTVHVDPAMPLVQLDFGLIEQAVANLLHNAAVHTPRDTAIRVDASHSDGTCTIVVSDAGPGLPTEGAQRVFDKFYRAPTAKTGGTGLGLPIAKGFVEAHRGTITAKNHPGGGAEFTIRIPVKSTAIEPPAGAH